MKIFTFTLLLSLFSGPAFALTLTNKSIRIGNAKSPSAFSICVANQAVSQRLADGYE